MKERFIDILVSVGAIITAPIWIILVIIILFSIPKDYFDKMNEYREAME